MILHKIKSFLKRKNQTQGCSSSRLEEIRTYIPDFVEFISQKRNISIEQAEKLVECARAQFPGGWGGMEFRHFTELALETFRPLYDETSPDALVETYRFHGPVDFLRMLSYPIPSELDLYSIVSKLSGKTTVDIVDYGCGLAHRTVMVSKILIAQGSQVRLHLVDIRRDLHCEFLDNLCRKFKIPYEFVEVSQNQFYPELPAHDYCDAVSVLEHIPEPLIVLNNIHSKLKPDGILLAAVEDEAREMMHVSPNLQSVRSRLSELGYAVTGECRGVGVFQI